MSTIKQDKAARKKEKPKTCVTLGDYFKTIPEFEDLCKNLPKGKHDNKKH